MAARRMPKTFSAGHREIWLLRTRRVVFNHTAMSMTHPLTTTTFELPGYRVTKSLGVVRGIIVSKTFSPS